MSIPWMIGNQYRDTQPLRFCDTGNAGHAVIDRDQQGRRSSGSDPNNLRCKSIAELEAIRHEIVDLGETEVPETTHYQCCTCRTIGIEIADHGDMPVSELEKQLDGVRDAVQRAYRCKLRQAVIQMVRQVQRS